MRTIEVIKSDVALVFGMVGLKGLNLEEDMNHPMDMDRTIRTLEQSEEADDRQGATLLIELSNEWQDVLDFQNQMKINAKLEKLRWYFIESISQIDVNSITDDQKREIIDRFKDEADGLNERQIESMWQNAEMSVAYP